MNDRDIQTAERKPTGVVIILCVLCLCGSTVFAGNAENWPRLYNNGVSAYQSNDFARAAAGFENATASADRALQQRALYNLGNTDYRLGQSQPAQAQQLWQRAIKNYQNALALNPQDADAKFNQEFVKKKLEELKKQQQEQKQKQQNQKNQPDKKQDQKKDEQKQQRQGGRGREEESDQQSQNSKDEHSEQQKQQQSQQSQEQQNQQQEQKKKQQEQQTQQQKPSSPEQKPPESGSQPEDYDKMQATALLNDLRENEQNWNFFPEVQMKDLKKSGEPAKDW